LCSFVSFVVKSSLGLHLVDFVNYIVAVRNY
jgi:hypothetical protein